MSWGFKNSHMQSRQLLVFSRRFLLTSLLIKNTRSVCTHFATREKVADLWHSVAEKSSGKFVHSGASTHTTAQVSSTWWFRNASNSWAQPGVTTALHRQQYSTEEDRRRVRVCTKQQEEVCSRRRRRCLRRSQLNESVCICATSVELVLLWLVLGSRRSSELTYRRGPWVIHLTVKSPRPLHCWISTAGDFLSLRTFSSQVVTNYVRWKM